MPQNQLLTCLECVLENLPVSTLYCNTQSTSYNFSISNDDVEEYGNENSAMLISNRYFFEACFRTHKSHLSLSMPLPVRPPSRK